MDGAILSGEPHPKSAQLARGERRYRRKVASPKQWQEIIAAKRGACRNCGTKRAISQCEFHHLVPRSWGGDDVADNIIPLHPACHTYVTARNRFALYRVAESLSDAEYAYVIGKLGEGGPERLFGVSGRG